MTTEENTSSSLPQWDGTMNATHYDSCSPALPDDNQFVLNLIINKLHLYFLPLIIFVGCVGNILSLYVILKSHLRLQSSNIYLAFLSMVDTGFLMILVLVWVDFLEEHSIFPTNGFCQAIPYITYVLGFLSVYTVVSFTVERFIITFLPLQRQTLCTTARAKMVVIGLVLFAMIFYSFPLYMSTVTVHGDDRSCIPKPQFMTVAFILSSVDTVLTLVLPSMVIITLNVAIIVKIARLYSNRTSLTLGRQTSRRTQRLDAATTVLVHGSTQNNNGSFHRTVSLVKMGRASLDRGSQHQGVQTRTTRTLLILSTTFVMLNLPSHVMRVYLFIISLADTSLSSQHIGNIYAVQELVQFVYYINFASNFFMYSICSRAFREAANSLLWGEMKKTFRKLTSNMCAFSKRDHAIMDFEMDCRKSSPVTERIRMSRM